MRHSSGKIFCGCNFSDMINYKNINLLASIEIFGVDLRWVGTEENENMN